jgi:hypothetical protein
MRARNASRVSGEPIFWLMPMCSSLRQVHQHAAGDADLAGQARTLGADRVLDHLHHQGLALEEQLLDRRGAAVARRREAAAGLVQVGHMQEGGALQPDVDEGRLHAGQHARHLAEVDVADQATFERALDVQLLHRTVLDDRHPRLLRSPVDQDVFQSSCAVSNKGRPMMPEWLPSMRSIQAAKRPWMAYAPALPIGPSASTLAP